MLWPQNIYKKDSSDIIAHFLTASYRLTLEEETADGETPLTLATQAGLVEIVQTLLDHGASPHKTNGRNESPLLLGITTSLLTDQSNRKNSMHKFQWHKIS